MIIGTTPTLTFSTNKKEEEISEVYITIVQAGKGPTPIFICEHGIDKCTFGNMTVSTKLEESETAWIDPTQGPIRMQVTIVDNEGNIYKSEIVKEEVIDSLREVEK